MAPVTELVVLPIKPDIGAEAVDEAMKTNIATLLAQKGCERVRSSRVVEEPGKLRLFADWASLEAHEAFAADAAVYGPFLKRMGPLIDAASFTADNPRRPPFHVEFSPYPPKALDAVGSPVAEILQMFFPADISDELRAKTLATMTDFLGLAVADGITGENALGWSVERDVLFQGQPCRVLVVVIGWTSVEAHAKVRGSEEFAKLIPILRNLEGLKGREVCHVSNTVVEKGS
ncbi:hypothetical protein F4804DRAFT_252106 [Jackrogersella minutella]|nr:hypothetical protein F4804DRAFT_252106 [Jackrogersella minutella]